MLPFFTDQGRSVPLPGIKAVLQIGASQRIDYADSAGNFEFNNIQYDPTVTYLIQFEMTDGKSFEFIDARKYNPNSSTDPTGIKSRVMRLPLDPTVSNNQFAIDLSLNMPSSYSSSESYYINKVYDTQAKFVNFYNRVLNERPPLIPVYVFNSGGSSYSPTVWDPNTNNVDIGFRHPKIRIMDSPYDLWSAVGMEYTHYVQDFSYRKMHGIDGSPMQGNHFGFNNPSTADSWIEGVGTFMPAVIADWYGLGNSGYFSGRNLESNIYKPQSTALSYSGYWLDEEYAIATLLWDLYDKRQDGENTSLGISKVWSIIESFDNYDKHNTQDYMKKYSYSKPIPYDQRHIKYFKDLYDFMSNYDVNLDGRVDSNDQNIVDGIFEMHGISNGLTTAGRPRV